VCTMVRAGAGVGAGWRSAAPGAASRNGLAPATEGQMAEAKERPVAVVVNPEPDPQESRPAKIATWIVKAKKPRRR
jgi:hypothetical protein